MDRFDVIIVGMGVGGEAAAGRLLAAGRRVAIIERELIGGECAYWACIPSKTLLRGPEVRAEASRAAGWPPPRSTGRGCATTTTTWSATWTTPPRSRTTSRPGRRSSRGRPGSPGPAGWRPAGSCWKPAMW